MPQPTYPSSSAYPPSRHHRSHPILRLGMLWAGVAIVAMVAFGVFAWAVGLVFHLIGLLFEVAIITAVAAVVWRVLTHRGRRY